MWEADPLLHCRPKERWCIFAESAPVVYRFPFKFRNRDFSLAGFWLQKDLQLFWTIAEMPRDTGLLAASQAFGSKKAIKCPVLLEDTWCTPWFLQDAWRSRLYISKMTLTLQDCLKCFCFKKARAWLHRDALGIGVVQVRFTEVKHPVLEYLEYLTIGKLPGWARGQENSMMSQIQVILYYDAKKEGTWRC